jgi:hypothetical protein
VQHGMGSHHDTKQGRGAGRTLDAKAKCDSLMNMQWLRTLRGASTVLHILPFTGTTYRQRWCGQEMRPHWANAVSQSNTSARHATVRLVAAKVACTERLSAWVRTE